MYANNLMKGFNTWQKNELFFCSTCFLYDAFLRCSGLVPKQMIDVVNRKQEAHQLVGNSAHSKNQIKRC